MRFLSSEYHQPPAAEALFQVIPVPFEASVSYGGGTAGGPAAILEASDQLEAYDGIDCPGDRGIYTQPPVPCQGVAADVFPEIARAVRAGVLARAPGPPAIPVVIGGEHSVTGAAWEGVIQARGAGAPLPGLIQIDAHADLRDRYQGSEFSHASVVRRIHTIWHPRVYQIGVRALCTEEVAYRSAHAATPNQAIQWHDAAQLVPPGSPPVEIPADFPDEVYLTVDVDGLDPSICPATGTPVPGGLGWYQTLSIIEGIARSRRIIAFDVVELAPIPGLHAPQYAVAELTYRIMGMIARNQNST